MVEITEVYDTGEVMISNLKTIKSEYFVMANDKDSTIKQFVFKDGKCEFVKSIKVPILDLTVTKEGHILASDGNSEVIYNLTGSGTESFKSIVSPRKARGIHFSGNQTLFVGFTDPTSLESGIVIFDMKSDQNQEIALKTDSGLNCLPEKIISYINGDICVIQSENFTTWNGIIVSYEIRPSLGQVKWIYKGHDHINMLKAFSPRDFVITSSGLVLTVDDLTSIIHVLSTSGNFLTFIGAREGVYSPCSLNVDIEGQLQIGSYDTNGESAKIYVAKMHSVT
ncbi:unnamed protein product [Mytilus edulis]|uniref:Uncharacterized protein n=1 Tax=Mytilus edulis TaxID=6550 RepID=A0A8S3UCU1_MYTED|nr:unnamed protein product [Mytilus edulis]